MAEKTMPSYDKMGQVRWMVDEMKENFESTWSLEKFLTLNEMMVRYIGKYRPA
jgi:hypothetical protein